MNIKEINPLIEEYYAMSLEEVHQYLDELLVHFSKKDLAKALGITLSGIYTYFEGRRKISFAYYVKLMTLDKQGRFYAKYQPVLKSIHRYEKMTVADKKAKVKEMTKIYGYPKLASFAGINEANIHYYLSAKCNDIPYDKYIRLLSANGCKMKNQKMELKKKMVIEMRSKLNE